MAMPVVNIPAPRVIPAHDYTELGKNLAMAINPMGGMQAQLIPLLFKAKLEKQARQESMMEFAKLAERSGNGAKGGYKWSYHPDKGFSYQQVGEAEQEKNEIARKRRDFRSGGEEGDALTLPNVVTQIPTGGEGPSGQVPDMIPNPNFQATGEGNALIPNPAAIEARSKRLIAERANIVEKRNKAKEIRALQTKVEGVGAETRIIEKDIDDLFATFKEIPRGFRGPFQQVRGFSAKTFQTPAGEKIKDYTNSIDFFLSNIARKLGGERGVLTDRDIERVKAIFPSLQDEDPVATAKMDRIKRFINRRIVEHRETSLRQIQNIQEGGTTTPLTEGQLQIGRFTVEVE